MKRAFVEPMERTEKKAIPVMSDLPVYLGRRVVADPRVSLDCLVVEVPMDVRDHRVPWGPRVNADPKENEVKLGFLVLMVVLSLVSGVRVVSLVKRVAKVNQVLLVFRVLQERRDPKELLALLDVQDNPDRKVLKENLVLPEKFSTVLKGLRVLAVFLDCPVQGALRAIKVLMTSSVRA